MAEDDVAGDNELSGAFFCAETFAGALGGAVGAALGGVGSGAVVEEGGAGGVRGAERERKCEGM